MGIGEERPIQEFFLHRHAACHVHLLHQVGREGIEESVGIEAVIQRIEMKILNIKKQAGAGLAADQIEELGIGQI